MMEYKGYLGMVEYDAEAKIFHGDIINTRDVITFRGTTVNEIEQAFKASIDDYIAWCFTLNMANFVKNHSKKA
jgi:predicted HicB family RNase H-like nuclease